MSVPSYETFYHSFLLALADGKMHQFKDIKESVKQTENLSKEQLSKTNASGPFTWANRVGWCATCLKKAGVVVTPRRGIYQITREGFTAANPMKKSYCINRPRK